MSQAATGLGSHHFAAIEHGSRDEKSQGPFRADCDINVLRASLLSASAQGPRCRSKRHEGGLTSIENDLPSASDEGWRAQRLGS